MTTKNHSYLHLNQNIDPEDYVVCDYKVTTSLPMEDAAESIAAEQSTGTWTGITTLKSKVLEKYGARVTAIEGNRITVAFPAEDFSIDIGGVPQILSVIAGNLFGLEALTKVRLEDARFPKSILTQFPGPKHGADGLKSSLKRKNKPLVGTIVKPKIGLSPKEMADYVYEAGMGGLTNSKDDETLTNQKFCPIGERTRAIAEALDRLKQQDIHMMHAINVSTSGHRILEVADFVQSCGAKEIMVDVITCGFAAVQALAEDPSVKVPIHVHRTMHGAMTRDPNHGIAMLPIAKLSRMCGADALHIGTLGVGKMSGDVKGDMDNLHACLDEKAPYRTTMPVCSGGVYPGMIGRLIEKSGYTVQIQAGGAVAGHPGGVKKGAMAMSQAVDAAFKGIPVEKYAETHEELRIALEKWGKK